MTNLWTVEEEKPRINFSQMELLTEELTGKNGKYTKIMFILSPLDGGDLITENYFKFQGHSKPWDSDVLPAIRDLVISGKLPDASKIDDKWVSWEYRSWRSYRKNDIQYWRDRAETEKQNGQIEESQKSYSRIQNDEKGNEFVEKRYIHIVDIFASEDDVRKEHDNYYGISSTPEVFGEPETKQPENFLDKEKVLAFLPSFVKMAMDTNGNVDREKLITLINDNVDLKAHFTIDSDEVESEIAKVESAGIPF